MGYFYVPPPAQVGGAQPFAAPVHSIAFTGSVDAPPGRSVVFGNWGASDYVFYPGGRQPYAGKQIAALFGGVVVNPAPTIDAITAQNLAVIQASWQPGPPMPQRSGPLPVSVTAVAVSVTPPIGSISESNLSAILGTWQPGPPMPVQRVDLSAALLNIVVNQPPVYTVADDLVPILLTWNMPALPYPQRTLSNPALFVPLPGPGGGGGRRRRRPSLETKKWGAPWGPISSSNN